MKVLIIYCHPCKNSFTYDVKNSFIKGLQEAGHEYEITDLYEMNFNETFSENEYLREAFYNQRIPISDEVRKEQEKINAADVITFIYPVFWTEAPAKLVGWFQRVWTYGFAYGDSPSMKQLKKALFLVTLGGSLKDKVRVEQVEAMKTVMLGDRISSRAIKKEMIVFDQMTRGYGNDGQRKINIEKFLKQAFELGYRL